MVAAVRCPNPKCRKFMLVEDADQGKIVPCLICKQSVKVPLAGQHPHAAPPAPVAQPVAEEVLPVAELADVEGDLSPIFEDEGPQFKVD
jgi:hypothetical protein